MKVRVGFSTTSNFTSRVIRWFLGANISHTFIRYHDDFMDVDWVAHADWPGVLPILAERFDGENVTLEEYEFDIPKFALKYNLKLMGNRYDRLALLGWAWTIAFRRWVKKKVENPIENPKKQICVDFCLRVLNKAGITNIPPTSMNPLTFLMYLRDNHEALGGKRFVYESTGNAISNLISQGKDRKDS